MTGISNEFIELHNTVIEDIYLNTMITFKDKTAMVPLIFWGVLLSITAGRSVSISIKVAECGL